MSFRVDKNLKTQADELFKNLGMNTSVALNMFLTQCVREQSIPFIKDGKIINPLKFIESMEYEDCNKALLKIFPKIDLEDIKELFDSIPFEHNGLSVLSEQQRELYYKSLEYKYAKAFEPIYNKLLEKSKEDDLEI